jgi:separase
MQQAQVFANQGLLQEAIYTAEQAEKVASAVTARSLLVENASRRAEYWAHGGKADKAQKALQLPDEYLAQKHICLAAYHLASASISHLTTEFDNEGAAYQVVDSLLKELTSPSFIAGMSTTSTTVENLTDKLAKVTLGPSTTQKKPAARTRGRKPAAKPAPKAAPKAAPRTRKTAAKVAPADVAPTTSIAEECAPLCSLQADVMRRRALLNLAQEEVAKAFDLLNQAQVIENNAEQNVSHQWLSFKASLLQSMTQLAADFTFNTLPESTIAFPAARLKDRTASESTPGKRPAIVPATFAKGARGKKAIKADFVTTLREARDRLIESHNLCAQIGSSYSFQQASLALAHVTVLLSAVSGGDLRGSLHPLYAAYMSGKFCQSS